MAVEKDVTRKCVVITWDTSIVLGDTCTIDAENVETGALGGAGEQRNDGSFPLAYPLEYTGASFVTITGSDGGEDSGEIQVGNYVPLEPGEPGAPPVVDNTLPGRGSAGGEHPDHELPGRGSAGGEHPDHTLPGEAQPKK